MILFKKALILFITLVIILSATSCGLAREELEGSDSNSEYYSDSGSSNSSISGDNSSNSGENIEHIEGNGEEIKNDFSRYSIIATKSNALALEAATNLSESLSKKGFSLSLNKSSVYEIIVGNNTASETKAAITELSKTDKDYMIKFCGTKIIVVAKNDLILSEACNIFIETYIKNMSGKTLNVKDGTTTLGISQNLTTLAYDGIAQYEIVFGNVSAEVKSKAEELASFIKTMCGITSIKSNATYDKSKKQILVGPAGFSETSSVIRSLADGKAIITKVDNKIIVTGKNDEATISAIDAFMDVIDKAKSNNTKKGNYAISVTKSIIDTYCASLDSIPKFSGATYSATYPSGDGISQLYYTSADSSKINAYVTQIEGLGYKKVEDNSTNGNRFVTCYGKNGIVHISYLNHNKTLSVVLDSLKNSVYKENEPAYTKVTDSSLAVMSLDYVLNDETHRSGMSYIITLEDGRYIIIDGGYRDTNTGSSDAYIIYNYMKENNKRADKKIIIAAWIFTHDHSDHHGAFSEFASNYSTKAEIQYYIMNCGDKSNFTQKPSGWLNGGLIDLMKSKFPNAKLIIPHTGQKLTFCNTTFDILSTQESHTPNKIEWVNDASIVFSMTSNGVRTLFLADAEAQTTKLINNMYGSTIKSDILQIAHHGYSGGSVDLYKKVAAKWTLWPTSQSAFNERKIGSGNGNAQEQNKWAANNSTCVVADDKIEILTFVGGSSKISISTYTANYNK